MPKSSSQLKNIEGHNILQSVHDYNEEVSFIVCGRQLLTVDLCEESYNVEGVPIKDWERYVNSNPSK